MRNAELKEENRLQAVFDITGWREAERLPYEFFTLNSKLITR